MKTHCAVRAAPDPARFTRRRAWAPGNISIRTPRRQRSDSMSDAACSRWSAVVTRPPPHRELRVHAFGARTSAAWHALSFPLANTVHTGRPAAMRSPGCGRHRSTSPDSRAGRAGQDGLGRNGSSVSHALVSPHTSRRAKTTALPNAPTPRRRERSNWVAIRPGMRRVRAEHEVRRRARRSMDAD